MMSSRSVIHAWSARSQIAGAAVALLGLASVGAGTAFAQQPPPFAPPVLAPAPGASTAELAPAPGPAPVAGASFVAPTGEFGSPHQVVVNVDLQFSIIRASSSENGSTSSTSVVIQPALDYFIAPNLSVGGLLSYAHGVAAKIGDNTVGLQVRAGYNLKIDDNFSFWPRLGLGYFHGTGASTPGGDTSGYAIPLDIFAPVLWHVTPHLFIGVGPTLETDLVASSGGHSAAKLTFVGLQSVVGGYFGTN